MVRDAGLPIRGPAVSGRAVDGGSDVRPLKVGDDQAQEGGRRRQARQAVRPPDQERRGRGAHRRRRPGRQPDALRRHPEGEEELGPERQHRPRGQARLRPGGRRRRLADHHVRGLRPQRRRDADRVPHRQPQPRRHRGAHRADPQRRLARRRRLGVVHVLPQGRGDRAQGGPVRGRRAARGPRRRRRGGQRPRRGVRGGLRADRPGPGAHGAAGRRHRLRVGRVVVRPQRAPCRWTRTAPARSSS